ncbi:MAG: hypothetical protein WCF81_07570 [Roseiarcus sp.]
MPKFMHPKFGRALFALVAAALLPWASAHADIQVAWTPVGYPKDALKIAACSPSKLFALNKDHTLWVSYAGGTDGHWRYVTKPVAAASIACDGNTLVVMNADKSVWRGVWSGNTFKGWIQYSNAADALTIGGGPGVVTAINKDQSIWTSTANDKTEFPGQVWWPRGSARDAARLTGIQAWSGYNPWRLADNVARFFALNDNGSLWFNDGVVLDNPGTWRGYAAFRGQPGVKPAEFAAASPTQLYVLDTTAHLWSATTPALPASVTFSLNGTQTPHGDRAVGNITITQGGSWSVSSAHIQFVDKGLSSIGYTLNCHASTLDVHWGGQVGGNVATPPTETLNGNGNDGHLADNWAGIVADAQKSSNLASCILNVGDASNNGPCTVAGSGGCACLPNGGCANASLVCLGNTCIPCGGEGKQCCAGRKCAAGLRCQPSPSQNSPAICLR